MILCTSSQAQTIDIRAYKIRLSDVMEQIGAKAKKKIVLNTDQNPLISIGSKDSNLDDTLKKIQNLYGFEFEVTKDEIVVKDKPGAAQSSGGRGLASIDESIPKDQMTPTEMRSSGYRYRTIGMNNIDPAPVLKRIKTILGDEAKYIEADDKNKTIVIYSDEQQYRLVRQIVDDLDVIPPQILLAAKVVEATDSFAHDVGVVLNRNAGTSAGIISSNNPSNANQGSIEYTFGIIDSVGLDATLAAGESKGVAKVMSNPQMVTSDNVAASLNSGLTFSVRVSNVQSGSTTGGAVVAGGLQSVTAGLQLNVTPKVLRDGKVGLKVEVNSSSVDQGSSVDGIPGIDSTDVKTEMVVRQGQTAAIGGLYKHTNDDSDSGVPLFMDVPIFGFLFKNNTKSKVRQEIMAFITPTLLENTTDKVINFEPAKKEAEVPLVIPSYH